MCQRKIAYWVIPPDADAEFAAHMEEVLETDARPFDSDCPVLCMDEQPVHLIRETRTPMPATRNRPRRVDYEFERAGTASVFMFCEPLWGWRQATARTRCYGRSMACQPVVFIPAYMQSHSDWPEVGDSKVMSTSQRSPSSYSRTRSAVFAPVLTYV